VFVLDSNQKGAIAETQIAAAAVRLGIPVFSPVTEHGRYDLVFEIASRLWKVQCKWGALDEHGSVMTVYLHSCRFSPSGYIRKPYTEEEIDLVAVYCGELDRCYLLPSSVLAERSTMSLRLSAPRNSQRACINLASEFEFAGAVAQLEERRHGMAEARGSSPLSSTGAPDGRQDRIVGANRFRNLFGHFMERAAAGEEFLITRHGRPFVRLLPAELTESLRAA
jgi:prevent-host-death family protein